MSKLFLFLLMHFERRCVFFKNTDRKKGNSGHEMNRLSAAHIFLHLIKLNEVSKTFCSDSIVKMKVASRRWTRLLRKRLKVHWKNVTLLFWNSNMLLALLSVCIANHHLQRLFTKKLDHVLGLGQIKNRKIHCCQF